MGKVDSSSWGYKKPATKAEKSAMQTDRIAWVRSWATGKNIPADHRAAHTLARTAAKQMKRAGLYSSNTYDYDIASSIISTLENLGIRKRYTPPTAPTPQPESARDEAARPAMTMRDYFAAKAMCATIIGMGSNWPTTEDFGTDGGAENCYRATANDAYAMADAMEAARGKK